eukprot:TRINITY_DN65909_c0_g1_i1.p1 TRINITY_DN65909_c0_g1~~TRINITY_DN65909_c0_g1_i1.p1  ORF type:complete len:1296 (+),score=196.27 TRINITY_DN65909_c0_g1_i1:270-3890(+)
MSPGSPGGASGSPRSLLQTARRATAHNLLARAISPRHSVRCDDGRNPLLSPLSDLLGARSGPAVAAALAARLQPQGNSSSPRAGLAEEGISSGGGFGGRLCDGLDGCGYTGTMERIAEVKEQMRAATLQRDDYPAPGERVSVFDWAVALPAAFRGRFNAEERSVLGRAYNFRAQFRLEFWDCDMIQSAEERMPCGGCAPRTPLRYCGIHGTEQIGLCAKSTRCLQAGTTKGGATCLLDNFARTGNRVAALLSAEPGTEGGVDAELTAALALDTPDEWAEGFASTFAYTYEIKAPPGGERDSDGSRPTQLYRLLGCAMRSLGDPASRERLSVEERLLWEAVAELFRPLQWRLDRMLLALPHQPHVVYRGIDVQVADNYDVDSIVIWPPVTSTSGSREVAWDFMSSAGAGTFWIILAESVANISRFSWLPGEEEWLLHSQSIHKVSSKLNPALLAALHTNHDILAVIQVDDRGGGQLSAAEVVDSRALIIAKSSRIFDDFLAAFVPPEVRVGDTDGGLEQCGAGQPLSDAVCDWCRSPCRTALLVGAAGSGKSTTGLYLIRAATGHIDSLPLPAGQAGPWMPIHVSLPAVHRLLAPGTGEDGQDRPLLDHIAKSNHLNVAQIAELQRRNVLFVFDGLEEAAAEPERLRGRGLIEGGGLSLGDWPHAKVVVCVRQDMLEQSRGMPYRRWRLSTRDVLPSARLWHIQPFSETSAAAFCEKVIRKELFKFADAMSRTANPGRERHEEALRAMRCIPPSLDAADRLVEEVHRLFAAGAAAAAAVKQAVYHSDAGALCLEQMLAATAAVVERVARADMSIVSSPFTLSMIVAAGRELEAADLSGGARRAVYRVWTAAEVRLRLPRIAALSRQSAEFAALDEEGRVQLVLDFCGRLACSALMIDVSPSLALHATVHRFVRTRRIGSVRLSPLGSNFNMMLLQAAPMRVEKGADGMLSFVHASLQDYFAARRVDALLSDHLDEHPEVLRFAVPLDAHCGLQFYGPETDRVAVRLRRKVRHWRLALCVVVAAMVVALIPFTFDLFAGWHHWLRLVYGCMTIVVAFVPRDRDADWPYQLFVVSLVLMAISRARVMELCMSDALPPDDTQERFTCRWPSVAVLHWFMAYLPLSFVVLEPQHIVAAVARVNLFHWQSREWWIATVLAYVSLAVVHVFAVVVLDIARDNTGLIPRDACGALLSGFLAYRTLQLRELEFVQ